MEPGKETIQRTDGLIKVREPRFQDLTAVSRMVYMPSIGFGNTHGTERIWHGRTR